uniref:Uncharacterized protein n=1 Tax=Setaria italica TaxID=4555 RepID=K3ZG74_SETIT
MMKQLPQALYSTDFSVMESYVIIAFVVFNLKHLQFKHYLTFQFFSFDVMLVFFCFFLLCQTKLSLLE